MRLQNARRRGFSFWVSACAFAVVVGPLGAEDWPRWRGSRQDGIALETGLLKAWPEGGPKQLWSTPLSGGFSSVVVANGKLFTQTKKDKQEVVLCLDPATGKEIWRYGYDCDYKAHPTFTGGGRPASRTGPRATPAVSGDRVFTLGATGTLLCLDTKSGKPLWEKDLLKMAGRTCPTHGYCASPLIEGDKLYVQVGGGNGKAVACLDKYRGDIIWFGLDDALGQATPVFVPSEDAGQVIFFTGTAAAGLSPIKGKFLWRYPWKTRYDLNIATPIYHDGKVFISSNYGTGAALLRLSGQAEPEVIWKGPSMQNHISCSVLYQGHLYGASESRLRCVDFQTGKIMWDQPGFGKSSLLVAEGNLIVLGEFGQLALAKAVPAQYTEISRCQLFDKQTLTWTVPVLSGGRLFVRSESQLVALDLRVDSTQ